MNKKQKIVTWVAIVVIALMIIFPPIGEPLVTFDATDTPLGRSVVTGFIASYGFIISDYNNIKYITI